MTITKRLILTLSTALLALLFVGVDGLLQLQRAQQRLELIQNRIIPAMDSLNRLKGYLADSRLAGYRLSVFANLADKSSLQRRSMLQIIRWTQNSRVTSVNCSSTRKIAH